MRAWRTVSFDVRIGDANGGDGERQQSEARGGEVAVGIVSCRMARDFVDLGWGGGAPSFRGGAVRLCSIPVASLASPRRPASVRVTPRAFRFHTVVLPGSTPLDLLFPPRGKLRGAPPRPHRTASCASY